MELTLQAMKTLSELMDQALDLDEDKRSRWVADLSTGPHAALQPFLADMLARQADMETAFMVKAITLPAASTPTTEAGAATNVLISGARVGPYLLEREVGHGGMGAVWLATRVDGAMTRQVALKLPTVHLTAALAERFDRERDILAQLTHPNIARLYDAGVSETGRPYLALEYVEGKAITEHCDAINLPIPERLRRFLQVASAVQYAHANLVIHRDLKPSNILVSEDGQVHLLDFGIAKLLDDPKGQAADSELTMLAGRALTLDYASPEQVNGSAISTASDVYSIGVVLYQLLTGQKPYQLRRGSRAELEEAIVTTDAALMSDAARRGDGATATQRGLSKDRLARALAGDLDTIVAKAMKKDPLQRYTTVAAFAEDIQRHLDGLPVEAQPDSWQYRAGKFVARNRVGVLASTVVIAALVLGLGTALRQTGIAQDEARRADAAAQQARSEQVRADQQAQQALLHGARADREAVAAQDAAARADTQAKAAINEAKRADNESASARLAAQRADAEAGKAKSEAQRSASVQDFLASLFKANSNDQKNAVQIRNLNARQLLDRGVDRLSDNRDVPADVSAELFRLFGTLYSQLDENAKAKQVLERALMVAERAHGRSSLRYAEAQLELAWAAGEDQLGSRMDLIENAREFLTVRAPGSALLARAHTYEAQNSLLMDQSRALAAASRALELLNRYPDEGKLRAIALRAAAHASRMKGDHVRAIDGYRMAAQQFADLYGADNIEVGESKGSLATSLRMLLRLREAEKTVQEAVAIMRPFDGALTDAKAFGRRAIVLMAERGRAEEADVAMTRVKATLPQPVGEPHRLDFPVAVALANIALLRGDFARGLQMAKQANVLYDGKSPFTRTEILTLEAQSSLGLNDVAGAEAAIQEARRLLGTRVPPLALAQGVYGAAVEIAGRKGDVQALETEYQALQRQFPEYRAALLLQLQMDVSRAAAYRSLGEHESLLTVTNRWLESTDVEMPAAVRGELALLAAEASRSLSGKADPRWLGLAESTLVGNDVASSPRLVRLAALKQ